MSTNRGYHCRLCGDGLSITAPLMQIHEASGTRGYPLCRACLRRLDDLITAIRRENGQDD